MSIGPRELALYVVDCSASMGEPVDFTLGERTSSVTPLSVSLQYVKAKIAQRIMRELKTTPCGVLTYGARKTKNVMTSREKARLGDAYDKSEDAYRNCYEEISISYFPSAQMITHLDDSVEAGRDPDKAADAHTAIILAIETVDQDAKSKSYKKEIVLLTDGESSCDWDNWESTASRMEERKIELTVIGMNFDDEESGVVAERKSATKARNERYLRKLTAESGTFATTAEALQAIAEPSVREVASVLTQTVLSFGDTDDPDSSIKIPIAVKKATATAPIQSMKQMSTKGFERVVGNSAQSQSQHRGRPSGDAAANEQPTDAKHTLTTRPSDAPSNFISMGNIGKTYGRTLEEAGLAPGGEDAHLVSHDVVRETHFFYRPSGIPKDAATKKGVPATATATATATPGDADAEVDEEPALRPTGLAQLTEAHYYGGSLIETGDLEEGAGRLKLEPGMQIVGFAKRSAIRYDWRLNEVNYVYAIDGMTGSQLMLSTFITAMNERQCVAIVRYVAKGMKSKGVFRLPDPKMGVLFPVSSSPEFCYFCQLPFAEDIRALSFPSFKNLFNRKGERITTHNLLPTEAMNDAMAAFVDSMDLTMDGEEDDEGNPVTWFNVQDSFSPAVHNVMNTLVYRLSNIEGELPLVPSTITKYQDPPAFVVAKSRETRKRVIDALDIKIIPPKPKKISKKAQTYNASAADDIQYDRLFDSALLPSAGGFSSLPTGGVGNMYLRDSRQLPERSEPVVEPKDDMDVDVDAKASPPTLSAMAPITRIVADESDEEPETEDDEDDSQDVATPVSRAISDKTPLADFTKVLKAHGSVTAIESMFVTIATLVQSSFSTANYSEAINCIHQAKETAEKSPSGEAAFAGARTALVAKFGDDARKRDFVALMGREGV